MKIKFKLFLLSTFMLGALNAQTTFSVGELNLYVGEYLKPMATGMATGMGSGWAHTAKVHGTLGFDISLSAVIVNFPSSANEMATSSLTSMIENGYSFDTDMLPTVVSDQDAIGDISKSFGQVAGQNIDLVIPAFDGLDVPFAPNFALQAAVGLPKGTEVILRYVPEVGETISDVIDSDDLSITKMNMWGVGVKHDIKQWIPFMKKIPLIEVSGLLAYSGFNFDMSSPSIAITPGLLSEASKIAITGDKSADSFYEDQGFEMSMSSFTGSLLIGANIPVIHPFIGVGFNKASYESTFVGSYPIIEINDNATSTDNALVVNEVEKDPIKIEADKTFFNFQAGVNVKIAFFSIHAQYTYQEYSMYSAGLAFGFR